MWLTVTCGTVMLGLVVGSSEIREANFREDRVMLINATLIMSVLMGVLCIAGFFVMKANAQSFVPSAYGGLLMLLAYTARGRKVLTCLEN